MKSGLVAVAVVVSSLAFIAPTPVMGADCQMAANEQGALSLSRPTGGSLIKEFGDQYDETIKAKAFHDGIDLDDAQGEPVYAARSGQVVEAGEKGDLGLYVRIAHGGGVETGYGHLGTNSVRAGECITGGRQIGTVGQTGRAGRTMLHFEVWRAGKPVNPLDFLH